MALRMAPATWRRGRRQKPGAEGSAAYREGLEAGAGGGGVGRGAYVSDKCGR